VSFNAILKLIVIAIFLAIYRVPPTWGLLLAPLAIFALILLGICVGLLLTPMGMLYTDVATSIPIAIQLFFFVTPVVYPPPQSYPFSLIAILNPISPLLIAARDLLTKGVVTNLVPFSVVCGITLVALLFAWTIYRVALPIIIERMSA